MRCLSVLFTCILDANGYRPVMKAWRDLGTDKTRCKSDFTLEFELTGSIP